MGLTIYACMCEIASVGSLCSNQRQQRILHVALCCIIAFVPTKNSKIPIHVHLRRHHCVCCSVVAGYKEATALQLGIDSLSGGPHSNQSIFAKIMKVTACAATVYAQTLYHGTCLSLWKSFATASL